MMRVALGLAGMGLTMMSFSDPASAQVARFNPALQAGVSSPLLAEVQFTPGESESFCQAASPECVHMGLDPAWAEFVVADPACGRMAVLASNSAVGWADASTLVITAVVEEASASGPALPAWRRAP